jgi:hypothetical protein
MQAANSTANAMSLQPTCFAAANATSLQTTQFRQRVTNSLQNNTTSAANHNFAAEHAIQQ